MTERYTAATNQKRRESMRRHWRAQPAGRPPLSDAEWEVRFQKLVDPHYYDHDERSIMGSSLNFSNDGSPDLD